VRNTMKFRKQNDIIVDGVRPGYTLRDSVSLRKETDHNPKIQIFSYQDEEDQQEPEERIYWCAMCKSKLEYLNGSDTIWRCDNCMSYYDTKIQDSVVKDKEDFKLTPYSGLQHYPVFDADDPNLPFVEAINPDARDQEDPPDLEILRTSSDQRVQHIRVRGSPGDALRLVSEHDRRNRGLQRQ
jgi:DNA-directed RNA polymerase subunit RPC12/RpoP